MNSKPEMSLSQEELVGLHLINRGSISSAEAFELYGITRLSARIFKLRQRGWNISSEPATDKNRYGHTVNFVRYRMGD